MNSQRDGVDTEDGLQFNTASDIEWNTTLPLSGNRALLHNADTWENGLHQ